MIFLPIGIFGYGRSLQMVYGENSKLLIHFIIELIGLQGYGSYNITWWFNKLIILLYLLFPVIWLACKKGGLLALLASASLMVFSERLSLLNYYSLLFWQFPLVLGVVWKEKENDMFKLLIGRKIQCRTILIVSIFVVVALFFYREGSFYKIPFLKRGAYIDGLLTLFMALILVFARPITIQLRKILAYLGKHSMNIYMTHTFFFSYWFSRFFYSNVLAKGWNLVVLLGICLLVSICLEWVKEKIGWNKVFNTIIEKIDVL